MNCNPDMVLSILTDTKTKKDSEGYVAFDCIIEAAQHEDNLLCEADIVAAIGELEDRGLALPYDLDREPQHNRWRTP